MKKDEQKLDIIGGTALVTIGDYKNIPAKIDTGADSTSIWASNIQIDKNDNLNFTLFAPGSKFYTGEFLICKEYKATVIRSSNGDEEVRYRTRLPFVINGRKITTPVTLADRSKNHFPILIGRKTLRNKFLVDVSKSEVERPKPNPKNTKLNEELEKNPQKFHKKYIED